VGGEEEVFGELLGDGGGAPGAAVFELVFDGVLDLLPVEAVVLVEVSVFGGDDSPLEGAGDALEGDEGVALDVFALVEPGFDAALEVDGGEGGIEELEKEKGGDDPDVVGQGQEESPTEEAAEQRRGLLFGQLSG